MLGLVITTDGKMYKKHFTTPLCESVEPVIGGFERVSPQLLPEPFCMIVDGDFQRKDYPVNPVGSLWYNAYPNLIEGDIVVMKIGWTTDGRDILGLSEDECNCIINLVYEMTDEQYRLVKEPDHEIL